MTQTMNPNNKIHKSIKWGIPLFDHATSGLPAFNSSVIETPNYHTGILVLGHYLYQGLKEGSKVALVTFDSPTMFLENFLQWNINFMPYIESEQMIFLNYNPSVGTEIALAHNYLGLFSEITRLCGNQAPDRIAFHQVDTLISLGNMVLMNTCVQKFNHASNDIATKKTSVLGQFVQFGDQTHHDLGIAFQKAVPGYFSLSHPPGSRPETYEFNTKKLPWHEYDQNPVKVELEEGFGFLKDGENESSNLCKIAS